MEISPLQIGIIAGIILIVLIAWVYLRIRSLSNKVVDCEKKTDGSIALLKLILKNRQAELKKMGDEGDKGDEGDEGDEDYCIDSCKLDKNSLIEIERSESKIIDLKDDDVDEDQLIRQQLE